jgi:hypothetical protein
MRQYVGTWQLVAAGILVAAGACASSDAGNIDAGGVIADAAPVTADAFDPCSNINCVGLQYCNEFGVCVDFDECAMAPDAGVVADAGLIDGGTNPDPFQECPGTTVCRNGVCVPGDQDFDGDGYVAGEDCDEQNANVHPDAIELCNGIDDDCVAGVDDGDPVALCLADPSGDVCEMGSCGCQPGTFDIDPNIPNCECVAAPALDQGTSCATAIDLGNMNDTGAQQMSTGNVAPLGRRIWYRFRGVDNVDTTCDNYHVRIQMTSNPNDQFRIGVLRGTCADPMPAEGITDYVWATDMRTTINSVLTGECPCAAAGTTPATNVSLCQDNSADYFFYVERLAAAPLTCDTYSVEVSNGLYDWM